MIERVPVVTDFYVIHYEAYRHTAYGRGERRPLAGVIAMPRGAACPPNAVAGPFRTRHEAERAKQEKRAGFVTHWHRA